MSLSSFEEASERNVDESVARTRQTSTTSPADVSVGAGKRRNER
jgi:hypothetical protein